MQVRAKAFWRWLLAQPQSHIAVVSHSAFLYLMVHCCGHNLTSEVQLALQKGFRNGEMRTIVLASSSTNVSSCLGQAHPTGRFVPEQ